MQDRYIGDIGDYAKYGLLRAIQGSRKLGIAWYLFPDEQHNADGKHITFYQQPKKWRYMDAPLFDELKQIVVSGKRSVKEVSERGIFTNVVFHSELLKNSSTSIKDRQSWRKNWFDGVLKKVSDANIVFADPDNGLCLDERFSYGGSKSWKRLPISEALRLAEGRVAVIYHHNSRFKGGHAKEIEYWMNALGGNVVALRWRAYSSRTFFIVNPTEEIKRKCEAFSVHWGDKAEFVS
ncbi:hypothetical protein GCM10017044_10070 [Kordiimonas sediminis]|uniref:Uncharacterized protein n=1 Tax=Kordiimonas sediminis TaxID=1735581 RepID=A0A919E626_9PROT|nr:hypothetical protein [Kordiimonas sediminis]GHF17653.1 hypothetical protein GCM10017044_10070 [Kordiimonas sediminis]